MASDEVEGPANEDEDENGIELVDEELTEVFRCTDELTAQTAVEEVLAPAEIPSMVHNRVSHAFPAPASMSGAYFVAVPVAKAAEAAALLREALADGALAGGEVAPGGGGQ